jgi:hypothetical protein
MRWWPSSTRGCLAGRLEIREHSRRSGSHSGNPRYFRWAGIRSLLLSHPGPARPLPHLLRASVSYCRFVVLTPQKNLRPRIVTAITLTAVDLVGVQKRLMRRFCPPRSTVGRRGHLPTVRKGTPCPLSQRRKEGTVSSFQDAVSVSGGSLAAARDFFFEGNGRERGRETSSAVNARSPQDQEASEHRGNESLTRNESCSHAAPTHPRPPA